MNYMEIAIESLMVDSFITRNMIINRMLAESEFIMTSLENGFIGEFVQEADLKDHSKKIINSLREFIDKMVLVFRNATVQKYKKYIDWVKEKSEDIKKKAAEGSITMAPYWNGNQKTGEGQISTLINDAFKYPYQDDDISFATKILPSIKTKDELNDTGKISNMLKNKFRFGKDSEDSGDIKKETLEKNALVSKITDMIDYVINYESVSNGLKSISNNWKSKSENFQKALSESMYVLNKDMVLLVEDTILSCSDLCLIEGFDNLPEFLFEADDNKSDNDKKESPTDVQNNNAGNDKSDENKKSSGKDNSRYMMVDKFTRLAFSAYLTACEERFIVYIKCISQVLGESPKVNKKEK